jgi:sulfoxide reductase heme-binding subunit YedZ
LKPIVLLKRAIFAAALIPAAALVVGGFRDTLTANPIDYITDRTGDWAIRFLIISLAVTPVRRISGWNPVIQLRRMLGLFAFFYAALHFLTWFVLDWYFDIQSMLDDIFKRPFITLGMVTLLILLALALTSTTASIRRLGKRWTQLHRLVYVAAVTALTHFWLVGKILLTEVWYWAVALAALLGFRVWWALRAPRATAHPARAVPSSPRS